MKQYHKIQTVFKRDPENRHKTLLEGEFSIPEFEYLQDNDWIFTEKVDGTNIRVMFDGEKITFGGKTERAQIPA
ncbi:MAG: RNA ligase family protein, partial [bacterium]|nr:RNA ligase family protein [bacterium]